ncbi:hypothetical protein [Peribacillus phoenicis]|uniref:hypothetical protein n=1 Tax=unclassified Peribacillus TaxID=2675266 RepID=UPI0039A27486
MKAQNSRVKASNWRVNALNSRVKHELMSKSTNLTSKSQINEQIHQPHELMLQNFKEMPQILSKRNLKEKNTEKIQTVNEKET